MRDLNELNRYRRADAAVIERFGSAGNGECGNFELPSPKDGQTIRVIATAMEGWDHVSVSRRNRCPNWPEMEHVKRLFFRDDETAMQLHVPPSEHVNTHPYCLHIWRPHDAEIPKPPSIFVGHKDVTPEMMKQMGARL